MSLRSPLSRLRPQLNPLRAPRITNTPSRRPYSLKPPIPGSANTAASTTRAAASSRAERVLARLPPSLRKYTDRLRDAPVSHIVAFLLLHELTAIVPLFGLFGLFHYTDYVPVGYMLAHYGGLVREGAARFEKYFRKKGWFGFGPAGAEVEEAGAGMAEDGAVDDAGAVMRRWEADPKYKAVVEIALAYAITKVLLPVRIVGSVWATPWFARVLVRLRSWGR